MCSRASFAHVAETQPELVARHYTEALQLDRAFDYWQKAAEHARDRSANKEAIHHVAEGLKILDAMPESEARDRRELVLRIASFTPVIAVEGYAAEATARTAERALAALSETWRCRQAVSRAVHAVGQSNRQRQISATPCNLTEEFFREAERATGSGAALDEPSVARYFPVAWSATLPVAEVHLRESMALYEPQRHGELKNRGYGQDPYVDVRGVHGSRPLAARIFGRRGGLEPPRRSSMREQARHTNTLGYVLNFGAATFEAFRKDVARTAQHASDADRVRRDRRGCPSGSRTPGCCMGGRSRTPVTVAGRHCRNEEQDWWTSRMLSSTTASTSLHQGFMKSFLLSLLSEAYAIAGRPDEALAVLDTAWSFAEATGEAFWKAELQRLKGEMILEAGRHSVRQRVSGGRGVFSARPRNRAVTGCEGA